MKLEHSRRAPIEKRRKESGLGHWLSHHWRHRAGGAYGDGAKRLEAKPALFSTPPARRFTD